MSQNVSWLAIKLATKFKMPKNDGREKKGVINWQKEKKKKKPFNMQITQLRHYS